MPFPEKITDHEERALARLSTQFRDKPNIKAITEILAGQIQDIEDVFWQLLTEVGLYAFPPLVEAEGVQIDGIGRILGLARAKGQSDADYRTLLGAQIRLNLSNGEPETLISILGTLTNSDVIKMVEYFPGHVILTFDGVPLSGILGGLIQKAAAAGVRIDVVQAFPPLLQGTFKFSDTDASVLGSSQGFSDDSPPSGGFGKFADVI